MSVFTDSIYNTFKLGLFMINLENLALELDKYDIFEGMTSISAVINRAAFNNRTIKKVLFDQSNEKNISKKL